MKKHLAMALLAIMTAGLGLAANAQKQAAGGKTSPGVARCQAMFDLNDPGAASQNTTVGGYTLDGSGAYYVDYDRGLRCEIDTTTNTFFMDLNYFKYNGVRRQAWINLNHVYPGDPLRPYTGEQPLGIHLTSDFFYDSENLWSMPVGSSLVTGGQVMIPINGTYYHLFLGNKNGNLGTGVSASHPTATTWILTAPPGSIGDLKVFGRGNTGYQHVGFYYFGFTITIERI